MTDRCVWGLTIGLFLVFGANTSAAESFQVVNREPANSRLSTEQNLLSAGTVLDQTMGFDISYERALGLKSSLRVYGESRQIGFYSDDMGQRLGGGIGWRHYWWTKQALAGLFLELNASVFNISNTHNAFGGSNGTFTGYGPGFLFGWQIPLGVRFRLTPAYRVDALFPDVQTLGDANLLVRNDVLLYLGYAF